MIIHQTSALATVDRRYRVTRIGITAKFLLITLATLLHSADVANAQDQPKAADPYTTLTNQNYRAESSKSDPLSACRLDLYYPTNQENYATVVWFHGGGLTGGKRTIPSALKEKGIAIATVDYRLSPHVMVKDCIDDAAASVAWVFENIQRYGGSRERIFVSGHSAGGYLTSMLGFDKSWLNKYNVDADDIAGLIPYSGHTITHFTARKELGLRDTTPLIDALAPLYHLRADAPATLLITGDRELEMLGRYEENAYFWRMLKVAGHPNVELFELDGYNHGQMADPAHPLLLRFIDRQLAKSKAATK
ncbi:MAG: alpha/beta hydrolase [Rubripirellula sp.]|nr:alpha/beta hydrolase [Rubripirellula sp.]